MAEACVTPVRTSGDNELEKGERQKRRPGGRRAFNQAASFRFCKDCGFDSRKGGAMEGDEERNSVFWLMFYKDHSGRSAEHQLTWGKEWETDYLFCLLKARCV